MKNFKKTISAFIVIGIIGAILVVAGCGKSSSSSSTTQTQTYTVQKGTLSSTVSAVGSVSMPEQGQLTFGTGSSTSSLYSVKEINVSFGDEVKKGDVLAKIDTSALDTVITQAQSNLSTAQINLEDAQNPYTAADLAQYEAALENAQVSLAAAELALSQAQDAAISNLADAQAAVSDKELALNSAQLSLDNAQLGLKKVQGNLPIVQNADEITIAQKENDLTAAKRNYNTYVQANISILDRWDIAQQKAILELNIQVAQNALDKAKLDAESDLASAQYDVANAQYQVDSAQNGVTKAQKALKSAQDNVETTKANSAVTLQQKQAQLSSAKAALLKSQENLGKAQTPDSNTIELDQIKVDNAQSALDDAKAQLEAATIVAPYDGVVAAVNANVGDQVTSTEEIIYLVNTSNVEIASSVDETDVAKVKAGQTAIITLDAISSARLRGTVGAVSSLAKSTSGVVTYSFSIQVQNTQGYDLKEGMTAAAEIVILNKTDVLLVPSAAISRSGPNSVVQVVNSDGQTEQRTIQTGETNGTQTEVTSGLSEGEKILVKTSTTSSTTSSNRTPTGARGFFIGGGGGPPD